MLGQSKQKPTNEINSLKIAYSRKSISFTTLVCEISEIHHNSR